MLYLSDSDINFWNYLFSIGYNQYPEDYGKLHELGNYCNCITARGWLAAQADSLGRERSKYPDNEEILRLALLE